MIRKFIEDDKYDDIIKSAILNHNKIAIEEGLPERINLHAKIIRDADKTDIFYVLTQADKKELYGANVENEKMTDAVYEDFFENRLIKYEKVKTGVDLFAIHFSYIYDLYFSQTVEIINENKYLEKIYNRFSFKDEKTKERLDEIYKITKKYIEEKKDD